jgi:hypothetical protein
MTRKAQIHTIPIPPISREFATNLARRFKPLEVKSGVAHDDIMIDAGRQEVIKFVMAASVSHNQISGNPDDLRDSTNGRVNILTRIMQGFKDARN